MRTNIDIDEKLIEEAMALSGQKTKKAVVEEGLRRLIRLERQKKSLEELRGMGWEGDLEEMRLGWSLPRPSL
jgi:Arc/MetJ family transcription regulator